jgi:hypothetical protein
VPKAVIPFGAWEPDKAPHGHNGLTRADNVYPISNGYEPVGSFAAATVPRSGWSGGGAFISAGGTSYLLAGASTGLFSYSGSAWVSQYAVSAGRWRFSQNRALVVGVHGGAPVAFDLTTGSGGLLGGSPPAAAYTATVGEFTFLAGDPADISTVSWSGFGNAEIWTSGTSQSGALTLPDGGPITGLAGGDIGLVFQRGAIHRFQYVGGDTVWQRDKISSEVGCIAPGSIVQAGRLVFFLSERGFMLCDGQDVRPIGNERVDRTFFRTYERGELGAIYAATDPRHFLVAWTMPGNPGQVWLYNWSLDRWANVRFPLFGTFSGFTSNIAADAVDGLYPGGADAIALPMDSPIFSGGEPRIYYVQADGTLGTLTGPTLEAYFETPLNEIVPGQRVRPFMARPITDATTLTVKMDARARLGDDENIVLDSEVRASGDVPVRTEGRVFKLGLTIPDAGAWSFAQGIEVEFGSGGRR